MLYCSTRAGGKSATIRQLLASYPVTCPSLYNTAANGSRCSKRSVWNRTGGYAPKCVPDDATPEDVRRFRAGDRN